MLAFNMLLQPGCSFVDVFGTSPIVYAMFNQVCVQADECLHPLYRAQSNGNATIRLRGLNERAVMGHAAVRQITQAGSPWAPSSVAVSILPVFPPHTHTPKPQTAHPKPHTSNPTPHTLSNV